MKDIITLNKRKLTAIFCSAATLFSLTGFVSFAEESDTSKYADTQNWAYFGEGEGKDADVFFIAPTVDKKDEPLMDINDEENRERFIGALEMERGISKRKQNSQLQHRQLLQLRKQQRLRLQQQAAHQLLQAIIVRKPATAELHFL